MSELDSTTAPTDAAHDLKGTSDAETNFGDDNSSTNSGFSEQKTFLTLGLEDYHVPIDTYEGRHRYDPTFRWQEEEEKKLVRKVGNIPAIETLRDNG
jgi:hypothetical protein